MPNLALRTAKRLRTKDSECVLLIESAAENAAGTLEQLSLVSDEVFRVEKVDELSSAIERLASGGVGTVLLDLTSPDNHSVETLSQLHQAAPSVPILILCGADSEEKAKEAVGRGARDYLVKNQTDGYRLRRTVRAMLDSRSEETMSLEMEAASATLDAIGEAVIRTDLLGNVAYLNRTAEEMTGWRLKEAKSRPLAEVLRLAEVPGGAAPASDAGVATEENKIAMTVADPVNCILLRRDGFRWQIESKVTRLKGHDGRQMGTVVAFRDVSVARARSLEMSHLAQHDALTDLPNRMLFNDRLTQAISLAERQGKQLAVMFVDLDHFKKINDSLGHDVGDQLLQSVAGRLLACVRRSDTVSRLGGDEFVVLLFQVEHAEDAAVTARKILRALTSPHVIDNRSLDVHASIGVSTYPSDGQDAESLLSRADNAMYEAKQHGRNNYQFFRRDMQVRLAERQSLEADLRYALGRDEFLLHYQPKFNLQTGQVTGVEALIRWLHPQRGLVYPAQFVSIAEECGLILTIGQWVLLQACNQARAWNELGMGMVPVAVNVSAAEFEAADFLSGVRAVLISTGVKPQNLELEVTESVLMHDAESAVTKLVALKAMGVQIAIDDFGTGYSSFTYLRRFPSDALKLDQSFVQEITSDAGDATIVSAMINIGRSLRRRVIAEGIETREQLNFLQLHGCDEGQGYYFSRPVAADDATKLFHARMQMGAVR
jgi:diguanylate cyclase (GGDEF)-like protein/PAS domain S-box-containing protein